VLRKATAFPLSRQLPSKTLWGAIDDCCNRKVDFLGSAGPVRLFPEQAEQLSDSGTFCFYGNWVKDVRAGRAVNRT